LTISPLARWGDINLFELFDALRYPGFVKMARHGGGLYAQFGGGKGKVKQGLFVRLAKNLNSTSVRGW